MIKTFSAAAMFAAAVASASAQPLPAPPTEKYTAETGAACDNQTLQIYFQDGQSDLNVASQKLLKAAQSELTGCILGPVSLQVNASDAASLDAAETLAEARVKTVANALDTYDLSGTRLNTNFETSDASARIPGPMTRKVEVRLSAWAPHVG